MKNISKNQIDRAVIKVLKESNEVKEGWFSDLFKDSYSVYSEELEEIMQNLIENLYDDDELISNIASLYHKVKDSDLDRKDKRELIDIMQGVWQIMSQSQDQLKRYVNRLKMLR